jgi:predicted peroxiredoxin
MNNYNRSSVLSECCRVSESPELDNEYQQNHSSQKNQNPKGTQLADVISLYPNLANLKNYVVVLSSGAEDGGKRATLAFSAACTAQAMELDTQLFLVGDGSHWAYQGSCDGISQKGFPALTALMDFFIELEGKIFVCSACDTVCSLPQGSDGRPLVREPFIQPRGLASIMEHMVGGSSITF